MIVISFLDWAPVLEDPQSLGTAEFSVEHWNASSWSEAEWYHPHHYCFPYVLRFGLSFQSSLGPHHCSPFFVCF
jgi:hypothetical protein